MMIDATGGQQIRAAFTTAADTAGEHAEQIAGLARVLAGGAETYTGLGMSTSTVAHLRAAVASTTAAQTSLGEAVDQLQAALADFNERDGRVGDAVTETGNLMQPDGFTGFDQHHRGVAAEQTALSCTTLSYATLLDTENLTGWPVIIRGVDGLIGLDRGDDYVSITAGTAQQLASINPAGHDPNGKDRYAVLDAEDLPTLRRALNGAGRAATGGTTYRKQIAGSDIGDIEITVVEQPGVDPVVTFTVQPYIDEADTHKLTAASESDFGEIPDQIQDDETGHNRASTAQERAELRALNHADYQNWLRQNPPPQPLVVHLSVAMVDQLQNQLGTAAQDGAP